MRLARLLPHVLLLAVPAAAEETELRRHLREVIRRNDERGVPAPDFGGGHEWLNVSRPLTLSKDLKGKIVVLDFWTYCCINCLHVLPDLAYLERKYAGRPVAVVGCHSAKFENEAERRNIREAVLRHGIEHPVVVDRSFAIWRSFGARAWPTIALVGPEGQLLGMLSGEGNRERLDVFVEEALAYYGPRKVLSDDPLPIRLERDAFEPGDLAYPGKVLFHGGALYVADTNHNRVLALSPAGGFLWSAGSGAIGLVDGAPDRARFFHPQGLWVHGGALFVADTENHAVRRIDLETRRVTTVAGPGRPREVSLSSPWDLLVHEGFLYVAMAGTHQIWRMELPAGKIGPWAGSGAEARLDAAGTGGALAQPSGLAGDGTW
ncbi:MAG: thioredoxin-like domain-containing protein, partial [Planctomycetota bacterium]